MKGDNPVLLDIGLTDTETEDGPHVTRATEPSSPYSWKRTGALLTITLCFTAAAAIFTFHSEEEHLAVEADDLLHTLRQISGHAKAAIHLEGEYNKNLEKLVWKQGVFPHLAQGDLRLDHNNEIVIPRPGLYFVYSQVSLRISCSLDQRLHDGTIHSVAREVVHVSHAVKLCSASYRNTEECEKYETILRSVRTGCEKKASHKPEAEDKWYGSAYMGAVFKLHKNDRLKTVMEKKFLPLVEDNSGNTFFGKNRIYAHVGSENNDLVPPTFKTNMGKFSFYSTATRVWNALTPSLKKSKSLASFKTGLKKHLSACQRERK